MKATIVSMLPWELVEPRPSIIPAEFRIAAGSESDPSLTIIPDCIGVMYIDGDRGSMRVPKSGVEIATSLVNDFCSSIIAIDDNRRPGLFVIEGEISKPDLKGKYKTVTEQALQKHRNWMLELVKMADSDWVKYGKRPQLITDLQRFACKTLGFEREWLVTLESAKTVRCPLCQSLVSELAAVCSHCGCVLDKEKAAKFQVITR